MSGFYLLHRGWRDNPVFQDEPCSEREAWVWLIEDAAYADRKRRVGKVIVSIKRGQVAASTRFLAEAWKWSHGKVRRFLERLEKEGMTGTATDQGVSVITVCNYDEYQVPAQASDTPTGTEAAQKRHSSGTNENEGNQGKEKKDADDPRAAVGEPSGIDPAVEVIASLKASVARHWPGLGYTPRTTDLGTARQMLASADLPLISAAIEAACVAKARASPKAPPGSLAYFVKPVADAIASQNTPLPEGRAHDRTPRNRSRADEIQGHYAGVQEKILRSAGLWPGGPDGLDGGRAPAGDDHGGETLDGAYRVVGGPGAGYG